MEESISTPGEESKPAQTGRNKLQELRRNKRTATPTNAGGTRDVPAAVCPARTETGNIGGVSRRQVGCTPGNDTNDKSHQGTVLLATDDPAHSTLCTGVFPMSNKEKSTQGTTGIDGGHPRRVTVREGGHRCFGPISRDDRG